MSFPGPVKLTYFNLRGLAENSRLMLFIAKQQYEDFRYPLNMDNFAKPEMEADKALGKFHANLGKLPILEVGNLKIGSSRAIEGYLANKLGFMGSSPEEAGQIQNVCELLRDLKEIYNKDKAGLTGDAKEAAKAKFITEFLPPKMLTIETLLGDSGFCVGNKLSMADVCLWSFINDYFDDIEGAKASIAACPKCQTASEAVAVAAKDWLASRPITMF